MSLQRFYLTSYGSASDFPGPKVWKYAKDVKEENGSYGTIGIDQNGEPFIIAQEVVIIHNLAQIFVNFGELIILLSYETTFPI